MAVRHDPPGCRSPPTRLSRDEFLRAARVKYKRRGQPRPSDNELRRGRGCLGWSSGEDLQTQSRRKSSMRFTLRGMILAVMGVAFVLAAGLTIPHQKVVRG